MDQLRGPRERFNGSPRREGSLRRWHSPSEVAGAATGRPRLEGRGQGHAARVARLPLTNIRQVATPRRLCLYRHHSTDFRLQIHKTTPARTIRQLELGFLTDRRTTL